MIGAGFGRSGTTSLRKALQILGFAPWFNGDFANRASSMAAYQAHLDEVRRTVPPERLLEYDVKEGWAPLCHFLDRPLPVDHPFPNLNDRTFFRRVMLALRIVEWLVPAMVIAALTWVAAYMLR